MKKLSKLFASILAVAMVVSVISLPAAAHQKKKHETKPCGCDAYGYELFDDIVGICTDCRHSILDHVHWFGPIPYFGSCQHRDPVTPGGTEGSGTEGGNTEGGNTEGGNTEGGNTEGGNTEGGNTEGGNTEGGNTEGGNTEGGNTEGGNTEGGNTEGGNTEGGNTEGGNTEGGNTEGGNTEGGTTEGGNTEGGNTEGGNTEGGNTEGGNTEGGNTEGGNTTDIVDEDAPMADAPDDDADAEDTTTIVEDEVPLAAIPEGLKRAQVVNYLYEYELSEIRDVNEDFVCTFEDIENHEFYDAIVWAQFVGVAKGYDEKTFGPNEDVSYDELELFVTRYLDLVKSDTAVADFINELLGSFSTEGNAA